MEISINTIKGGYWDKIRSYDKVIDSISSCKNIYQLANAEKMIYFFIKLYPDIRLGANLHEILKVKINEFAVLN